MLGIAMALCASAALLVPGCGGGGSGAADVEEPPEPAPPAGRDQAAADVAGAYLASFASAPLGEPDYRHFSDSFTSDGMTAGDYVGLWFGNATGAVPLPDGVNLSWTAEDGAAWEEELQYTRSGLPALTAEGEPVWVKLAFRRRTTETFEDTAASYEGNGYHYIALLEDTAPPHSMRIVDHGPYHELELADRPPAAAPHYAVVMDIAFNGDQLYDGTAQEAFLRYQVPVDPGATLALSAQCGAVALAGGQPGTVGVSIEAGLFDDDSPALAEYEDWEGGSLHLWRTEYPSTDAPAGLAGDLHVPAELGPGIYTFFLAVETTGTDGAFVAEEFIAIPLSVR